MKLFCMLLFLIFFNSCFDRKDPSPCYFPFIFKTNKSIRSISFSQSSVGCGGMIASTRRIDSNVIKIEPKGLSVSSICPGKMTTYFTDSSVNVIYITKIISENKKCIMIKNIFYNSNNIQYENDSIIIPD